MAKKKKNNEITKEVQAEIIAHYKLNTSYQGSGKIIAGIDQSLTGTGLIIMRDDGQIICEKLIKPGKLRGVERLQFIRKEILTKLFEHKVDVVAIEDYSFGSKGRSIFDLGELGGVLRVALADNNYKYEEVSPSSLKGFIADNGAAKKPEMRAAVYRKYGIDISEDNICDAFSLARMCLVLGEALPTFCQKGGTDLIRKIRTKYNINLY